MALQQVFRISEGPDDPAGDEDPEGTCWEGMLDAIKAAAREL
jgi:hypothetical protein